MSLSTPHLPTHIHFEGINHFSRKHPDQFPQPGQLGAGLHSLCWL